MPTLLQSYLSWSNKFVIEYYVDDAGIERKRTRRATKEDRLCFTYLRPRPTGLCNSTEYRSNAP